MTAAMCQDGGGWSEEEFQKSNTPHIFELPFSGDYELSFTSPWVWW